jgi:hypothetical protein
MTLERSILVVLFLWLVWQQFEIQGVQRNLDNVLKLIRTVAGLPDKK